MFVSSESNFEDPPQGVHFARCVTLIDLGTQTESFEGRSKQMHKVIVGWELIGPMMSDGGSFEVWNFYTASLDKRANLRRDLENWRGRPFTDEELRRFDLKNLLGKACQVQIGVRTNGKIGFNAVMALPKEANVESERRRHTYFSLDPERFDYSTMLGLREGIQAKIKSSPQYGELIRSGKISADPPPPTAPVSGEEEDDAIPF